LRQRQVLLAGEIPVSGFTGQHQDFGEGHAEQAFQITSKRFRISPPKRLVIDLITAELFFSAKAGLDGKPINGLIF